MWIPRWLGETYSKLYVSFGTGTFTFDEARRGLGFSESKLSVALSKLHSCRAITLFEPTRPRRYRLLDPENFILVASGVVHNLDKIPQERYLRLICDTFRQTYRALDLSSFAVYGSVARGSASETSDVDILLVSDGFSGSMGSRVAELYKLEERAKPELEWLRKHGIYTNLSFYPLRTSELARLPLLLLDLTEEAVVLYDKDGILERALAELRARLARLGARKVSLGKGRWYWDLKPAYEFGEVVEI